MASLKDRLHRIERAIGETPARVIVFETEDDADSDACHSFLAGAGLTPTDDDLVVQLRRFDAAAGSLPSLVSVRKLAGQMN